MMDGAVPHPVLADGFLADVVEGLSRPRKTLPSKYFYDARGSALFDAICDLEEYYPTRTETALLARRAAGIAAFAGPDAALVELGSGSSVKVRLLLDALDRPALYVPVDISREHLLAAAARLAGDYPALTVVPVAADYVQGFALPCSLVPERTLAFFPGSTIGNFTPDEAAAFLARLGRRLGRGSRLIIGVDLKKRRDILEAAYDDAQGVTAAFNLNLLARINRELGGTFELDGFRHRAFYDEALGRIEMHLESVRPQTATAGGHRFQFERGETIHTEISCKYTVSEFQNLAAGAGWRALEAWTDDAQLFSIHALIFAG
ncbi:L-histidine N(alpha)-methyltransferase [Azospirillum sp.]|uniref:L-histidine N(alpha)-methyltransferase n=1 Tax=Azospirillum sp. TaxID=34012 RepID=UPI002D5FC447|nr:L-histidine N(alpha)-methyltransferase [Azospirillum sp.]HYD68573.1 L-histidine N(alpha)-methyltransferase [Azospirillum sp.]